jgi:hypothetical protein
MNRRKRNRQPFRPDINMTSLEVRVVLSAGGQGLSAFTALHAAPAAHVSSFASTSTGGQGTTGATLAQLSRGQLLLLYQTQFRAAASDLKNLLDSRIDQLYASGRPSADQLANLQTLVIGAVDATAFQVSSQVSLLPAASTAMVPNIQDALLGNNRSLIDRLNGVIGYDPFNGLAARLKSVLNRTVDQEANLATRQFRVFLDRTPLYQRSVDSAGNRVPIQRFMAQQVINQFANTYGALAQSYPSVADAALFAAGAASTTPSLQQAFFDQQFSPALGILTYQLASDLALFPGAQAALKSSLQQAFFGAPEASTAAVTSDPPSSQAVPDQVATPTSLFFGLAGVPPTSAGFAAGSATAFNNALGNMTGLLNNFFGLNPVTRTIMPTGQIPSIFSTSFTNFGNGFNNGFGNNGFIGLGTVPTGTTNFFTNGFNNGFFGLTNRFNTGFGFTQPTFASTGFGGVGGIGTGGTGIAPTGTGVGGAGTGAGLGGTGTGVGAGTGGVIGTGTGVTGVGTVGTGTSGLV